LLSNGKHLDAELGAGFALITTAPIAPADRDLLEGRGARVHIAEARGELAEWLHRGHATAAVVRPDRTVMRAGANTRWLCKSVPAFRDNAIVDADDALPLTHRERRL
jgi:3-(3-hydroxy-phenyl)propionate hydroxylase